MHFAKLTFLCLAVFVLASTPLGAHTFSGFFDSSQPFAVSGTIVKLDWVKPNTFIHVRVEDKTTGKMDLWAFETLPPSPLTGAYGITRDMLREGTAITVIGWKGIPTADWKAAIADPELAARVIAEKPAYAAQFEFADGRKFPLVHTVPTLP